MGPWLSQGVGPSSAILMQSQARSNEQGSSPKLSLERSLEIE